MAFRSNPLPANGALRAAWIAPLHFWHLASLDAPTVAVTWAWAIAWAAHLRLHGWAAAALALIVWTIYIADRLLDARASLETHANLDAYASLHFLRERHYFHWRHKRVLLPIAVLAALTAAGLVYAHLPAAAVRPDSLVAAATLVWLTSVHVQHRAPAPALASRERLQGVVVGTLFAAGCALPAWSQIVAVHTLAWLPFAAVAAYAALAWLNLHAISRWESQSESGIRMVAGILALTLLTLATFFTPRTAALLVAAACSAFLLVWLDGLRNRLTPLTLRAAADLVLLTPLLILPVATLLR